MKKKYLKAVLTAALLSTVSTAPLASADPLMCIIKGIANCPSSNWNGRKDYMEKIYKKCVGNINTPETQCIIDGMVACSYADTQKEISDCMDDYYSGCYRSSFYK